MPRSVFFDDEDGDAVICGVVTLVSRGATQIWMGSDDRVTQYRGRLEDWTAHFVSSEDAEMLTDLEEEAFQEIEIKAGVRAHPLPPPPRNVERAERVVEARANVEAPREIATWDSDAEDDENLEAPSDSDADDDDLDDDLDGALSRLNWVDVGRVLTDQRASSDSMPEAITPKWNLANFREESYLNWFLHYMPLSLISLIVAATNVKAREITWPSNQPWKRLRTGEFLRWLGVWVLMTVYPCPGSSRRGYWRGVLKFSQYMHEKRFENILRAFSLPQYKYTDEEWGGQGREHYEYKKFDPFFETRRFFDHIRPMFQNAMKPGGWLCIDESMFSWLGRCMKLPGWKVIKRKPHPIGLEAKTTACAVTGMLIDFEFQEGIEVMGHFRFVNDYNKSTAWLLRLTERWHNEEKRTVIADAAFAQVRAAVGLYKEGGLFLIGNVKGAKKFFPQRELRDECGDYERDKLVCLTKKATLKINDDDSLDIMATGWRCTGAMVVTYVHTGGCNTVGSDRLKRKYTQMSDGKVRVDTYHVKRPKVSAEYQKQMGAIDAHNFRRQSGKGTASLEKVCVTYNSKDRIFINIVGWILINMYLAKKYFEWGGHPKKSSGEVQEAIALALINNQWYAEHTPTNDADSENEEHNLDEHCIKHPKYNSNTCKHCWKRKTVYTCSKCSNPRTPTKRRDVGRLSGGEKLHRAGYMHFCKGECFREHDCGSVKQRRPKGFRNTAI